MLTPKSTEYQHQKILLQTHLTNGRNIFHITLMNPVAWTRYMAFKFFLYLKNKYNIKVNWNVTGKLAGFNYK